MKKTLLAIFLLSATIGRAQEISIIPMPAKLETQPGNFSISASTQIILAESGLERSARFLNDYLEKFYSFRLQVVKGTSPHNQKNTIVLDHEQMGHLVPGAYTMVINGKGVEIGGDNATGVFYAVQSLIQLLPLEKTKNLTVPFVTIDDRPRFAYRGMHLDVGRHFFPVDYIKKYIDFIAMHKMNTFHWHLTEDQGWRIEIKKYPRLTQVGGFRNGTIIGRNPGKGNDNTREGGFYT